MTSSQSIQIDVDLSFRDPYLATLGIMSYALRYMIGGLIVLTLFWAFCLVSGSLNLAHSDDAHTLGQLLFPFVIGGAPTIALLVPITAYIRVRRMLRAEGGRGKRHYVFNDEGVQLESPLADANVKWAAFLQARETRRCFLLYSAPGWANVLPKRDFENDSDLNDFRSLIRARVKKVRLRA